MSHAEKTPARARTERPAGGTGGNGVTAPAPRTGLDFIDHLQDEPSLHDRRGAALPASGAVPASVYEVLKRPGASLPSTVSAGATARLGGDFGDVRVHHDARAARDAHARAFNVGSHIVFGEGQFAPHTEEGRRVLDHELAHVMQRGLDPRPGPGLRLGASDSIHEAQADRIASAGSPAAARSLLGASPTLPANVIARLPEDPGGVGGVAEEPEHEAPAPAAAPTATPADATTAAPDRPTDAASLQRTIEARLTELERIINAPERGEESVRVHHALALGLREVRSSLAALEAAAATAPPARAQAIHTALPALYERAARVAPFYTQNRNANILASDSKTAAVRTCNITVMGMILEALGKTPADYAPGKDPRSGRVLASIISGFKADGRLSAARPEDLRMPDFMQVVFVHRTLTDAVELQKSTKKKPVPPGTLSAKSGLGLDAARLGSLAESGEAVDHAQLAADIERARKQAARRIVYSDRFDPIFEAFGAEVELHASFEESLSEALKKRAAAGVPAFRDIVSARAKTVDIREDIAAAEARRAKRQPQRADLAKQRDAEASALADLSQEAAAADKKAARARAAELKKQKNVVKQLDRELARADKEIGKIETKELPRLTGKYEAQQAIIAKNEAILADTARKIVKDGIITVAAYKARVLPPLAAALQQGKQVLVNLRNHFVRLVAISDKSVTVDDPARNTSNKYDVTWEQALAQGYFKNYLIVKAH